jgi:hypothetical protein
MKIKFQKPASGMFLNNLYLSRVFSIFAYGKFHQFHPAGSYPG